MLFAFGSNGNGQLSLAHKDDTYVPSECALPEHFPAARPKRIVAGGNHTLVLFPNGELFATGDNTHGQCGIPPSAGTSFSSFQKVDPPPENGIARWELVSAGWEFTVLVSSSGKIYSCGLGNKGELGLGLATSATVAREVQTFQHASVVSVASGVAHTLVVLSTGEIWGWGSGRKGQLGAPADARVPKPRRIQLDHDVAEAACGREFSFMISPSGDRHTLLGGEKYGIRESAPVQGQLHAWKQVGASWGGVYVLLGDGTIRAWGRNDRGQLPPAGLKDVTEMAVGSEHVLALTVVSESKNEKLLAWGWGEHGNCGKGRFEDGGGDVVGELFEINVNGGIAMGRVGAGCATSWLWKE